MTGLNLNKTSPSKNMNRSWNNPRLAAAMLACVAAGLTGGAIPGCGESEPERNSAAQSPTASRPAPAPAPTPEPVDVQRLIEHPAVQFPTSQAPTDESLAQAVVDLATAIASGDTQAMRRLLEPSAQAVLDHLLETGQWQSATSGLETVRVSSLQVEGQSARVGLGIEDPEGAYLLAWEARSAGGGWTFTGLAVPNAAAATAAELDGVSLVPASVPTAGSEQDAGESAPQQQPGQTEPQRQRERSQPDRRVG